MTWKTIDSAPKDKWILVKALTEKGPFEEEFILSDNEDNYYIFIARLDSEYNKWNVNTNTCGCCPREIKPFQWKEIE